MPTQPEIRTRLTGELEALLERRQHALRGLERLCLVRALEQDPELVPAQPRDRVRRAHAAQEPLGHQLQHLVARGVPEPVVDGLEVVEVDEQHRHVRIAAAERVLGPVVEERAVRQPGQLVVEGAVAELLLEALAGVVVAHGQHQAADTRVVDQVGGHHGHVPVRALGVDHPPLGLRRLAARLVGHGGQEAGDTGDVAGMHTVQQQVAGVAAERRGRAGHRLQLPRGVHDQDQIRRVAHDRLQPIAALLRDPLEGDRVLQPAAPLVREQREQGGQREQGRGRGGMLIHRPRREQADGREQEVDEVGPGVGAQVVARVDAEPDPHPQRADDEVEPGLHDERRGHEHGGRRHRSGIGREREQRRGPERVPRVADPQQDAQRLHLPAHELRQAREEARREHEQRHDGRLQEHEHRDHREHDRARVALADGELDARDHGVEHGQADAGRAG